MDVTIYPEVKQEMNLLPITRKVLMELTGATVNQIAYLREMNRLPIARKALGAGDSTIYAPEAVKLVKQHLERTSNRKTKTA